MTKPIAFGVRVARAILNPIAARLALLGSWIVEALQKWEQTNEIDWDTRHD
jgi:hypothetical protein